jgi:hypothetical protein
MAKSGATKQVRGKKLLAAVCGAVAAFGLSASSFGSMLVDFKPLPVTANVPELEWTGTKLVPGAGSVGNFDGGSPANLQSPPGLQIETPYTIPGAIPGKVIGGTGSTTFYDVTLELTGLNANGAAISFSGLAVQGFGAGTFKLLATDNVTVLLAGNIDSGSITGLNPGTSGAVLSGSIHYTGGAIFDEFFNNHSGSKDGGSLSFSMLDIVPALGGTTIVPPNLYATLNPFGANATGLFSGVQVPEPATFSLALLGAVGLGLRRRTRKA